MMVVLVISVRIGLGNGCHVVLLVVDDNTMVSLEIAYASRPQREPRWQLQALRGNTDCPWIDAKGWYFGIGGA